MLDAAEESGWYRNRETRGAHYFMEGDRSSICNSVLFANDMRIQTLINAAGEWCVYCLEKGVAKSVKIR